MNPGSGAAILGIDGKVAAHTPNFPVTEAEGRVLAAALANPAGTTAALSGGFNLAGKKFKFLRFDGEANVMGKFEKESVSIYKTKSVILLNYADASIQPNAANAANFKMYDYFVKAGY